MASEIRRDLIILAVAGLLFFCSTQILSFIGSVYSSPDETANAFFSEIFATQGKLFSFEPLNSVLGDVLFPRSVVSVAGRLLPIGFLGLPVLFGSLIRIFGDWSLTLWTPLFAVLAVFAWYAITRRLFDRQIGLWSALTLFVFPAWWYWSSRPLMPNVLLVCFLIFGAFFLAERPIKFLKEKFGWLDFILAGLFFGFSLWIRTFEVFWLSFSLVATLVFLRKYISWKAVVLFLASLVITVVPLLTLNNSLYGGPFKTGYTVGDSNAVLTDVVIDNVVGGVDMAVDVIGSEVTNSPLQTITDVVAPFGLYRQTIINHLKDYFLFMFWWLVIPAIIGLFFAWPRVSERGARRAGRWLYLFLTVETILWLGSVYGSWTVHDNPDLSVTIGNSYTRYWLPIFVLLTPLVAVAVVKLGSRSFIKKFRATILVIVFLIMLSFGTYSVFFASADSLWPMRVRTVEAAKIHDRVLELTELNAVIIVDRADKLFFPARRVRYPLRDETTYALLPKFAPLAPLYYYGITFPQADLDYLNNDKFKKLGLKIELVESFGEETLYRISLE